MLVRQIVIPISAEELWGALTEPDGLGAWFGSQVEWDVRPGGRARFLDDEGTVREGVVEVVVPGRRLCFRWWPEGEARQRSSQVSYDLEPEEEGTRLTVTEERVPAPPAPSSTPPPTPSASVLPAGDTAIDVDVWWTVWDDRLFRCWARAAPRVRAR